MLYMLCKFESMSVGKVSGGDDCDRKTTALVNHAGFKWPTNNREFSPSFTLSHCLATDSKRGGGGSAEGFYERNIMCGLKSQEERQRRGRHITTMSFNSR